MNVVEIASELIRTPSMNPMGRPVDGAGFGESQMSLRLTQIFQAMGATVTIQEVAPGRNNVIAYFDAGSSETILFEAHLDTVPADNMTVEPFSAEQRDGRIYGRGACDVKGPMAAMLCAVHNSLGRLNANLIFAAVCDEEYQFRGVRYYVESLDASARQTIGYAIVAEPTELQPVVAHKGGMRWRVHTRGVAAHSSRPELGRNAIYTMSKVVTELEAYASSLGKSRSHDKLGSPTLSVGIINGGSAANIVPDLCTIEIDRRLIPGETPDAATTELREVLSSLDCEVEAPYMTCDPLSTAEDSPATRACIRAAEKAGVIATPQYANYCTDASFYSTAGIPAVVFGPGNIGQAHTKDEFIELDALERGVVAYESLLRK